MIVTTLLPFRAKSYDVTIYYGKIDPATFRASLNGVPFAGFVIDEKQLSCVYKTGKARPHRVPQEKIGK